MPEYMECKIIEIDENRCEYLNDILDDTKALIIHGDGRDIPLLNEEGIRSTQAFVALTGNAETNILACLTAKRLGVRKTVAVVENVDYVSMAESLDIGTIINKKAIAASYIYQMMLDADVMNVRFLMNANADVAEFIAKEGSKVTKKPVKDLGLPIGVTIGGLVRKNEGMLVSGNTQRYHQKHCFEKKQLSKYLAYQLMIDHIKYFSIFFMLILWQNTMTESPGSIWILNGITLIPT